MTQLNPESVRQTLEREIPEFRTGDGIGVLFGFLISASLTSLLGIALYFVAARGEVTAVGVILSSLLALILGFLVGRASSGSNTIAGAGMVEDGLEMRQSWFHRDRGDDLMAAGMVIFFCSFIFGGLYETVNYLRQKGKVGDDNKSRIAAGIVIYLVQQKAVPQADIVSSLQQQGVSPQETREVLATLTRKGFVESNPERMWFSPDKRHLL